MNGTRPVFADDSSSFFVFALSFIRFVEIPPASQLEAGLDAETLEALSFASPNDRGRTAAPPRPSGPPAVRPGVPGKPPSTPQPEPELEIDEDFLKRVRDI